MNSLIEMKQTIISLQPVMMELKFILGGLTGIGTIFISQPERVDEAMRVVGYFGTLMGALMTTVMFINGSIKLYRSWKGKQEQKED